MASLYQYVGQLHCKRRGSNRGQDSSLIDVTHQPLNRIYGYISLTINRKLHGPCVERTWSETPAWFQAKLSTASNASITLSFSDVSDAHQFFPSPLRSSDNLDCRANPPHGRNTDISCR